VKSTIRRGCGTTKTVSEEIARECQKRIENYKQLQKKIEETVAASGCWKQRMVISSARSASCLPVAATVAANVRWFFLNSSASLLIFSEELNA
jgi:hypothetical protein